MKNKILTPQNEYEQNLKKFKELESELVTLISDSENEKLQSVFLKWQESRHIVNSSFQNLYWPKNID